MLSCFEMSLRMLLGLDRRRRVEVEVTSSVAVANATFVQQKMMMKDAAIIINPTNTAVVALDLIGLQTTRQRIDDIIM